MSQDLTQRVASNVRAEMARRRVSQARLGQELGISQPQVSERLAGKIAFDTAELGAVAAFLGLPVTQLLGEAAPVTAGSGPTHPGPTHPPSPSVPGPAKDAA